MKTGYNAAFIVDDATRAALLAEDPHSEELLKPILRGRDIRPYRAQWQGLWLIATFPSVGVQIGEYPAIKRHLLRYGRARLEQSGRTLTGGLRARKKGPHQWFELQDTCAYHEEFALPKLLWMDMSPEGRFCYSEDQIFCNDKAFLMTGRHLKYLCAVLNSSLLTWYVQRTALTTGLGLTQWKKFTVESVPCPLPTDREKEQYARCVDSLVDQAEDANPRELDQLVFDTYELGARERRWIASYATAPSKFLSNNSLSRSSSP